MSKTEFVTIANYCCFISSKQDAVTTVASTKLENLFDPLMDATCATAGRVVVFLVRKNTAKQVCLSTSQQFVKKRKSSFTCI